MCTHMTSDCSDTDASCQTYDDTMLSKPCLPGIMGDENGGGNLNCDGDTLKVEYHSTTDCTSDTSAECNFASVFSGGIEKCHFPFKFDDCTPFFGGLTYIKVNGTCPGGGADKPCFSRDAEACRVLDSAVSPTDAYRACFDEPALKTAERVKMADLSGGDYVLTAGKDLTYEITRVLVNQHRVEGQVNYSRVPAPDLPLVSPLHTYAQPGTTVARA